MMRIGMMLLKLSYVILGVIIGWCWVYLLVITFLIFFYGSSGVSVMLRLGVDVTENIVCYIGHYN